MARAHVYRPITDVAGNLLYGATVTVQADSGLPLTQPLFVDATSGASFTNPFTATSGIVDIWLAKPERLFITVVPVSGPSIGVSVDAQPSGDEAFYATDGRLVVTNAGTAGQSLRLVLPATPTVPGQAAWADVVGGAGLTPQVPVTSWDLTDGLVPGALTFSAVKNSLTVGASTPIGSPSVIVDSVGGTSLTRALLMPIPTDPSIAVGTPWEFTVTADWAVALTEAGVFSFWRKIVRDPALTVGSFTEMFVQVQTPAGWYTEPVGNPVTVSQDFAQYSITVPASTTGFRIRSRHVFNGDTSPGVLSKVSTEISGIKVIQGGLIPPHNHGDATAQTTVLGPSAVASASGSTAVGASATASGVSSIAIGPSASATAVSAIAVGNAASAAAASSIALGDSSSASQPHAVAAGPSAVASADSALAVGYLANAGGASSIAVGASAAASGSYATAIGAGTIASGDRSVALGYNAAASHSDAMAIGSGAATTATSQIVLGAPTHVVYVPGTFRLLGDGVIGGGGSKIGFYGTIGVTQPTVTGSRSGNAALAALLTSLASTGLIVNSSSA